MKINNAISFYKLTRAENWLVMIECKVAVLLNG